MWVRIVGVAATLALAGGATAGAQQTRKAAEWPFAATSPWNMALGSGAKYEDPACDTLIRSEALKRTEWTGDDLLDEPLRQKIPFVNSVEHSVPVYGARDTDPLKTFYKGDNPDLTVPNGTAMAKDVRVPDAAAPAAGVDRSMVVIDPLGTTSVETWRTFVNPGFVNARHVSRHDLVKGDGFLDLGTPASGIRAAKASLLGGLIRTHELERGVIPHALAIALPQSLMKAEQVGGIDVPGEAYVPPASGVDGDTNGYTGLIPMGQLLALKQDVSLTKMYPPDRPAPLGTPRDLTSKEDRRVAHIIATALQTYGAYVVDTAGATVLFAEPSAHAMVEGVGNHYDDQQHSDLKNIVSKLSCVSNNAGPNWGGGGTPLAPPPPPFG